MHHGNPDKIINDNISLSLTLKQIHPKLLDQALLVLYVLRGTLYSFISKILMVYNQLNLFSKENVLELFESFHNSQDFFFCQFCNLIARLVYFEREKASGLPPFVITAPSCTSNASVWIVSFCEIRISKDSLLENECFHLIKCLCTNWSTFYGAIFVGLPLVNFRSSANISLRFYHKLWKQCTIPRACLTCF